MQFFGEKKVEVHITNPCLVVQTEITNSYLVIFIVTAAKL